jgi:hypothetical protein
MIFPDDFHRLLHWDIAWRTLDPLGARNARGNRGLRMRLVKRFLHRILAFLGKDDQIALTV